MFLAALLCFQTSTDAISKQIESQVANDDLRAQTFRGKFEKALQSVHGSFVENHVGVNWFQHTLGDSRGIMAYVQFHIAEGYVFAPVFMWPKDGRNHVQILTDLATSPSFTYGESYWKGDRLVTAGADFFNEAMPAELDVFRLYNDGWKSVQKLRDNLQGTASFVRSHGVIDPNRVKVRTFLNPPHLRQEKTDPRFRFANDWVMQDGGYNPGLPKQLYDAVNVLDRLASYAQAGDRSSFDSEVPASCREKLWSVLKVRPRAMGSPNRSTFKFGTHGPSVTFAKQNGHWRILKWVDRL